jgi:hypothetical protein
VKQFNHQAPLRPLIVLITDETGRHRSTPLDLDLSTQLRKPRQTIASILDPATWGIDSRAYLDKEAA